MDQSLPCDYLLCGPYDHLEFLHALQYPAREVEVGRRIWEASVPSCSPGECTQINSLELECWRNKKN